jgi:hypothetical protein
VAPPGAGCRPSFRLNQIGIYPFSQDKPGQRFFDAAAQHKISTSRCRLVSGVA